MSAGSVPSAIIAFACKEKAVRPARTILGPEQSTAVREQLLADIGQLQSPDEAADWVHKNLPLKNTLTTADADLVEAGFRERLATVESVPTTGEEQTAPKEGSAPSAEELFPASIGDRTAHPTTTLRAATVRRRRVTAKTIRLRDKEHCKFVTTQSCVVCGRTPSEALIFASPSRGRSDARSATNTQSRSAVSTTANSIATATKRHGGLLLALTRFQSHSAFGNDQEPTGVKRSRPDFRNQMWPAIPKRRTRRDQNLEGYVRSPAHSPWVTEGDLT
jgi:hypothetical protein